MDLRLIQQQLQRYPCLLQVFDVLVRVESRVQGRSSFEQQQGALVRFSQQLIGVEVSECGPQVLGRRPRLAPLPQRAGPLECLLEVELSIEDGRVW